MASLIEQQEQRRKVQLKKPEQYLEGIAQLPGDQGLLRLFLISEIRFWTILSGTVDNDCCDQCVSEAEGYNYINNIFINTISEIIGMERVSSISSRNYQIIGILKEIPKSVGYDSKIDIVVNDPIIQEYIGGRLSTEEALKVPCDFASVQKVAAGYRHRNSRLYGSLYRRHTMLQSIINESKNEKT
jgi:hypothetical protein